MWMPLVDRLLGLLFPERCCACRRSGAALCMPCRGALEPYNDDIPAALVLQHETRILYVYDQRLRAAIHQLKFRRQRRLARPLGELMALACDAWQPDVDAIIPIPLHAARQAERGFNQAEVLAAEVARQHRVPLIGEKLQRVRATRQQARLNTAERADNVAEAFAWSVADPPPRRILLVDDVLTTGATMAACTAVLLAAGAERVSGLALARSRLALRPANNPAIHTLR
ncbi:MAG TPA: ComF family protein [Roseiflexaceae bacterium]|nr:ComF family protein [Roseiflexaceae bacterium]HMP39428.1 ComF family protein [Roseiflexaceae bacterium]